VKVIAALNDSITDGYRAIGDAIDITLFD